MLVLSSAIASRYYDCCTDGSSSPGNYHIHSYINMTDILRFLWRLHGRYWPVGYITVQYVIINYVSEARTALIVRAGDRIVLYALKVLVPPKRSIAIYQTRARHILDCNLQSATYLNYECEIWSHDEIGLDTLKMESVCTISHILISTLLV
jgi:hypothetical protein